MTEDQADQIISLLEDISSHLSTISSNSYDLSSIESNTGDAVRELKQISSNTR